MSLTFALFWRLFRVRRKEKQYKHLSADINCQYKFTRRLTSPGIEKKNHDKSIHNNAQYMLYKKTRLYFSGRKTQIILNRFLKYFHR